MAERFTDRSRDRMECPGQVGPSADNVRGHFTGTQSEPPRAPPALIEKKASPRLTTDGLDDARSTEYSIKVASASLPGSSGSVQPRTRPRARGLRGSAEGRPCRSVFPSAVRNFHTFRPEAFDAVLRPQNLTGEVSAGVWRGRRPSRSDLPSRGVDGRRAYLVTSGSRAKPGTIVRGRYTFGWSIRGRRMVSCTRPLAQEHIPSSLA